MQAVRGHGQGQGAVGRHTGPWAGSESGREAYGDMGSVRERWGGIRGHGQGQGAVGRHTGTWAGSGSGWEAYGAMGRVRERWIHTYIVKLERQKFNKLKKKFFTQLIFLYDT